LLNERIDITKCFARDGTNYNNDLNPTVSVALDLPRNFKFEQLDRLIY
jgi:hypothetical protein